MMDKDRVLSLTGVNNFRDYGGYGVIGNAVLRRGILWRSAQHQKATASDLAAIDALRIEHIIDLRGDNERIAYPCRRAPGFAGRVQFAIGETAGLAPHLEAAKTAITGRAVHDRMLAVYATMPFRSPLVEALRLYIAALAQSLVPNGSSGSSSLVPSLVHCVAGKDRTGFAVALVHRLLGVHDDDVMSDYLLTNAAAQIDERLAQESQTFRNRYGARMTDEAIRTVMMVDPAYLEAAFAALHERYGSIAAYSEAILHVTPAMRERLTANLVTHEN